MNGLDHQNGEKVAKAIDNRIINVAKQVYEKSPNNKMQYGVVISRNGGIFSVKINKKIYTDIKALRNVGEINAGEVVHCLVPNNNFSNMVIIGVADGTINPGGSGGSPTWGSITGTLSNQTDLQSALNSKVNSSEVSTESSGDTIVRRNSSGDIAGRYITGTWLQTTAATELGSSNLFAVLNNGWIYYRTQNGVKSDLGITTIESLIPSQASSSNQLADKNFVNSSIGTNTANYISDNGQPFTSLAQLEAYTGTVTNNDYAFVTGTDEQGNTYFDRYKATVSGSSISWAKEYRLNNSSFTANQWESINSGISATLLASLARKSEIPTSVNGLTGGTITGNTTITASGTGDTALTLQSGAASSYVQFKNLNGQNLGYFGVNSSRQPVFYDNADHRLAYYSDLNNKANLSGGNTFSGNQVINDDIAYKYTTTFYNADRSYTSARCFGLYQWQDKFQYTYRDASNNSWLGTAFEIDAYNGTTDYKTRPTLNGQPLALASEIGSGSRILLSDTIVTVNSSATDTSTYTTIYTGANADKKTYQIYIRVAANTFNGANVITIDGLGDGTHTGDRVWGIISMSRQGSTSHSLFCYEAKMTSTTLGIRVYALNFDGTTAGLGTTKVYRVFEII